MVKVKALSTYKELDLKDKELGRIPEVGEEFEITEERYNLLTNNAYGKAFVEKVKVVKAFVEKESKPEDSTEEKEETKPVKKNKKKC